MSAVPSYVGPNRSGPSRELLIVGGALLVIGAAGAFYLGYANTLAYYGILAVGAAAVGFLLWSANPAFCLSGAIVLTPLSGHWADIGLPGGYVAPDRFLVVGACGAV